MKRLAVHATPRSRFVLQFRRISDTESIAYQGLVVMRRFGADRFLSEPRAGQDLGMRFAERGLVLGDETILVEVGVTPTGMAVDCDERRLLALLVAAHLRVPSTHEMAHLKKASQRWAEGQGALANITITYVPKEGL